jgi:membrane protein
VLALVPILLFAFAVLGFVLTVLRPELVDEIVNIVAGAVGTLDQATRENLVGLIRDTLGNWRGVGIVALLAAIYSGAGWMGNLKNAIRAQWRPDFDMQEDQGNILKKTVVNLITLVGFIVLIAVTFALASISTALADDVVRWIGLDHIGWLSPVLRIVPIIFSVGAGWVMFMYLFTVLPEEREPWPVVRRGALIGAIGLGVLQYSTGLLFNLFALNRAASIFGPVIALMLFFNIFAQLILLVAAWIATTSQEAVPVTEEKVRFPLTPAGEQSAEEEATEERPTAAGPKPVMVPQPVAARSVQVGLGAGYVTGTATGVGLGAALAWLLSKAVRGRR